MLRTSAVLPLLFLVLAFLPTARGESPPSFKDVESAFEAALDADDPDVRVHAYQTLYTSHDPRVVDLILHSLGKIEKQQEKIRRDQDGLEKDYENAFNDKLSADAEFERSSRSERDLKRYNEKVRKIERNLDRLRLQQKSLENDFTRSRALLDGAVTAMTKVLGNLGPEEIGPALDRVTEVWLGGRDEEDRLRWVYALGDLDGAVAGTRLAQAARDASLDLKVRAAALEALGGRHDPNAFHIAVPLLQSKETPWDLETAAIEALRLLHEERSIPPLIEYLGRDDIKRGREDAHQALKSLTGQKHGPYAQPWQKWWDENKDTWTMPAAPVNEDAADGHEKKGVTFYGITTFSNRILFVLDISGSMEQTPQKKDEIGRTVPDGPPKMDTAKKELIGAIGNLEEDAIFNIIFFNHEVVKWQPRMQEATESKKKRAIKWIEEQKPVGTTNIYDALEAAFAIALQATGDPLVDTIYFLTDGRPTSGKVRDSKRILHEVLEWNKAARIRIHTVGVGDHDAELLKALAENTGGTYVAR